MKKLRLRDIIFFVLCCDIGLFGKQLIAPAVNVVTDMLRIPGGIGTSFSLMFSVVVAFVLPQFGCATLMGVMQSVLALAMGMTGRLGILSPIGYIVPGIIIDCVVWACRKAKLSIKPSMVLTSILASVTAAVTASLLIFRLKGWPLILYISVGIAAGALFGGLAQLLYSRLLPLIRASDNGVVLKNRRNKISVVEYGRTKAVRKEFLNHAGYVREEEAYRILEPTGIAKAEILHKEEDVLILSYIDGVDYVELIEMQEKDGFSPIPWQRLYNWLRDFHRGTGLIYADPNLRNFLYKTETKESFGIDFEECVPGEWSCMMAEICAFVLLYYPEHTETKKAIVNLISDMCLHDYPMPAEDFAHSIEEAENRIRLRRERKMYGNK